MRILPTCGCAVLLAVTLHASMSAQTAATLSAEDASAIQALVAGYARTLAACDAEGYAGLFAPGTGAFASGFRGEIVGRERLIALVQSERHCIASAGAAAPRRGGGGNAPVAVLEPTPLGARGLVDLGNAGQYQDEYVKTPEGWRFASRTVLTPGEKAAGLDASEMRAIQRLAGPGLGDYYVADANGVMRLRTSGVAISVMGGAITGRAYLAAGGYYEDEYERTGPRQWRIKSRVLVPPTP